VAGPGGVYDCGSCGDARGLIEGMLILLISSLSVRGMLDKLANFHRSNTREYLLLSNTKSK
jgi:hypothetical protein